MILQIFVLEHYPLVAKRYLEKYFPNLNNDSLPKRFPIFKEWMDLLDAPSKNSHLKIDLKAGLRNEEINKVDYTPYQRLEPSYLPEILRCHRDLCLSQTDLICFEKAKYHLPHLSMWLKTLDIPKDSCKGFRKIPLKNTSRWGSKGRDYRTLLAKAIEQWDEWWQNRLKNIEPPISNNFPAFLAKKNLLGLDLNGILVDMVEKYDKSFHPDSKIRIKNVLLRQHCESFLKFCFEKFEVAIWTSRMRHNLESLIDNHFQDYRTCFLFIWDYGNCTNAKSFPHSSKPVLLKKIRKVWQAYPEYNESNTLLIDDSLYKALCNPEGTTIFPRSYCYKNKYNDSSLGPDGELRVYLENVAKATNVREYVEKNRLGLRPISNERPDGELRDYLENLAKDTNY